MKHHEIPWISETQLPYIALLPFEVTSDVTSLVHFGYSDEREGITMKFLERPFLQTATKLQQDEEHPATFF